MPTPSKAPLKERDCLALAGEILRKNPVLNDKIIKTLNCSDDNVLCGLHETIRFLHLVSLSKDVLTPAHRVDLVWHEFILFTRVYTQFCMDHFGNYIHHTPGGTKDENRVQLERTVSMYKHHFGEPNPFFWGKQPLKLEDIKCGACEGLNH